MKIKQLFKQFLNPPEVFNSSIAYKKHPKKQQPIFFSRPEESFSVGYSEEEFKQLTGITYLSHLQFMDLDTLIRIKGQCQRALKFGAIDQSMKWLGALYQKELRTGYVNSISIHWINNKIGYGVFANRTIRKGEFIGEYTGVVKRCRLFFSNVNEYCFHYPIYNLFINVHTIDASVMGNEIRFINHKIEGNCEAIICYDDNLLHVCLRAKEEIAQNEQLTYNYGSNWCGRMNPE